MATLNRLKELLFRPVHIPILSSVFDRLSLMWKWVRRHHLVWAWRVVLVMLGLSACAWTVATIAGCRRLDRVLEAVHTDPALSIPIPRDWSRPGPGENAAPYFSAAVLLIEDPGKAIDTVHAEFISRGWSHLPEAGRDRIKAWLAGKDMAFELATRGADRSWCRFNRNWGRAPWKVEHTEGMKLRNLVLALVARACVQASDGLQREARETTRVAFAAADALRDDPFLISLNYRAWCHEYIFRNLADIVPRGATAAELSEWSQIIPKEDFFDGSLDRATRWEIHLLSSLLSGPKSQFWEGIADWGDHRRGTWDVLRRLEDPVIMFEGARVLEYLSRKVRLLRKPYLEARVEAEQMEGELSHPSSFWHPLQGFFWLRGTGMLLNMVQDMRAKCAVLRTGLEWERVRSETGKYPEKCETIDPFTGNPLQVESNPGRLSTAGPPKRSKPFAWVLFKQP